MRRRWTVLALVVVLAAAGGACGSGSSSDLPSPTSGGPSTAPTGSTGTLGTTPIGSTATTGLVCNPEPGPVAPDTTPDGETVPDDPSSTSTAPGAIACSSDTAPDRPGSSSPTGSGRAPRLEALTAYLTTKYGDTPWRKQLADYDLSTADDQFELTITTRSTLPVSQAIEACKAVAGWSTSAFADGTITITDHDSHALAATPSARDRPCEAS